MVGNVLRQCLNFKARLLYILFCPAGFNFVLVIAIALFNGFNGIAGNERNEPISPELFNMF